MNWTGGKRAQHATTTSKASLAKKQKGFFAIQRQQNAVKASEAFGGGRGLSHARFGRVEESTRDEEREEREGGTTVADEEEFLRRRVGKGGSLGGKSEGFAGSEEWGFGERERPKPKPKTTEEKKKLLLEQSWFAPFPTTSRPAQRERPANIDPPRFKPVETKAFPRYNPSADPRQHHRNYASAFPAPSQATESIIMEVGDKTYYKHSGQHQTPASKAPEHNPSVFEEELKSVATSSMWHPETTIQSLPSSSSQRGPRKRSASTGTPFFPSDPEEYEQAAAEVRDILQNNHKMELDDFEDLESKVMGYESTFDGGQRHDSILDDHEMDMDMDMEMEMDIPVTEYMRDNSEDSVFAEVGSEYIRGPRVKRRRVETPGPARIKESYREPRRMPESPARTHAYSISTSLLPEVSKPAESYQESMNRFSSEHGIDVELDRRARSLSLPRMEDTQMEDDGRKTPDDLRPRISFPSDAGFSPHHLSRMNIVYPKGYQKIPDPRPRQTTPTPIRAPIQREPSPVVFQEIPNVQRIPAVPRELLAPKQRLVLEKPVYNTQKTIAEPIPLPKMPTPTGMMHERYYGERPTPNKRPTPPIINHEMPKQARRKSRAELSARWYALTHGIATR